MSVPSAFRAIVRSGRGRVGITQVDGRKAHPHELLIAPLYVGICGTDLQILRGMRSDRARVLGHEGVGEVIQAPASAKLERGQLVVFNPVNSHDQDDILGHSRDGLFQERVYVRISDASQAVVPYRPDLPLLAGPLVEPLAVAVYAHSLASSVCTPETVAVVGTGPMGMLCAAHARIGGAARVIGFGRSERRLAWLAHAGFLDHYHVISSDGGDLASLIDSVDVVYTCVPRDGARLALDIAGRVVRDGGCVDVIGGLSETEEWPPQGVLRLADLRRRNVCGIPPRGALVWAQLSDGKRVAATGHRGTSGDHLHAAMDLIGRSSDFLSRLITHVIAFDDAPRVLESLRDAPGVVDGRLSAKVVIDVGAQRARARSLRVRD